VADFLLEIGLEEVPARMIAGAQAELLKRTLALLAREQLVGAEPVAKSYSTPRRLAVLVENVREQQSDITEEVTGPAVKIAFKDGKPTPAAEAFARKSGVAVADLKTIATPKGEYLAATIVKKGRSAAEVLASELPKEIGAIYWAKNMYWRAGKPERFVRPVMWLACLLGESVVPLEFAGKTAGRASYGHRVLSSGEPFEIVSPQSYLAQLEGEFVLADVEVRRQKIRKALDKATRTVAGARWREDEALVDTVTHLTEWPEVLLGSFEPDYLALPEEVLVTVMRDHQKYFAVEGASGKLVPHFLTVTNIALDAENTAIIRQGNERVLRARFNDARFFWEFDQRTPLAERVKLLENVTFQKDLGSYGAKSERVFEISRRLAGIVEACGIPVNSNALLDAARLAKTDLTTELVKEFTELQGIIGGLYFKHEADKNLRLSEDKGRVQITWQAIYDQYLPASASDAIPRSREGCVLGLADRIDTIKGMFALGLEPTGSKDPFALRRAGNAIVRILAESDLPLKLSTVIASASPSPEVTTRLTSFFAERIDFYLRESRGQAYDVVKAVTASGQDDLRDAVARAQAVSTMRGSEDFLAVSAAFKRMKNILTQASANGDRWDSAWGGAVHPAEIVLQDAADDVRKRAELLAKLGRYQEALQAIASLRPEIDTFFDQVMILDSDPEVRRVRLGMLSIIVQDLSTIADFSEIVTSG
jgi:glycyl-tRNA synthetase beta chain